MKIKGTTPKAARNSSVVMKSAGLLMRFSTLNSFFGSTTAPRHAAYEMLFLLVPKPAGVGEYTYRP
jgi:hypothetical protein